jgi:hypothetical protein
MKFAFKISINKTILIGLAVLILLTILFIITKSYIIGRIITETFSTQQAPDNDDNDDNDDTVGEVGTELTGNEDVVKKFSENRPEYDNSINNVSSYNDYNSNISPESSNTNLKYLPTTNREQRLANNFKLHTPIEIPDLFDKKGIKKAQVELTNDQFNDLLHHVQTDNNKKQTHISTQYVEIPEIIHNNNEPHGSDSDSDNSIIGRDTINYIQRRVLDKINEQVGHNFIIIDNHIIKIMKSKRGNMYKYIFLLNIHRDFKIYGFQLYCEVIYRKDEPELFIINRIENRGNIPEQDFKLMSSLQRDSNTKFVYSNYPYDKYNTETNYNRDSTEDAIIPSNDDYFNIISQRFLDLVKSVKERGYHCVGDDQDNKFDCESKTDTNGARKQEGVWDMPCTQSSDCPFYKSNKNYPNERGGCINGICEMPVGIDGIGYHYYNHKENAYCGNCKKQGEYNCCEEQKTDSKLKTPDYLFINDLDERFKHKQIFENAKLKWNGQ